MPEDISDKITDFDLMLQGYVHNDETGATNTAEASIRIMQYWYEIYGDVVALIKKLEKQEKKK